MVRGSAIFFAMLIILGAFFFVSWRLLRNFTIIPPAQTTRIRIERLRTTLLDYHASHSAFPPTLAELPKDPDGKPPTSVDGWDQPITYTRTPENRITLTSLGADKSPNGTGDNKDLTLTFSPENKEGTWATQPTTATTSPATAPATQP